MILDEGEFYYKIKMRRKYQFLIDKVLLVGGAGEVS